MKTRIKYYGGYYYPQVRVWFWWKHIINGENYAFFLKMSDAVEFINLSGWKYNNKTVWESN
jgi:hypothetical protein